MLWKQKRVSDLCQMANGIAQLATPQIESITSEQGHVVPLCVYLLGYASLCQCCTMPSLPRSG